MKFHAFLYSFKTIFVLFFLILIHGIFGSEKLLANSNLPIGAQVFPRIGVLADTQITTDKGDTVFSVRSKFADKFVKVAIRPPALEHLDEKILKYFLDKITQNKADVILYLGDGGNSGCSDEINALFDIMTEHRENQKIPIYFVIGNHDYLGNGNITDVAVRKKLCGESNPPLNKFELINKVHDFNTINNTISDKFVYEDNFDSRNWGSKSESYRLCSKAVHREHLEGCFLAGRIRLKYNPDFEIFLTDTSDYKNIGLKPAEWYGTMGSISFKEENSQIAYFNGLHSKSKVRLIASHYPPTDFEFPLSEHIGRDFVGKSGDLLAENGNNYWISAHTHNNLSVKSFNFGDRYIVRALKFFLNRKPEERYFAHINVGSTTDYPPHAIIVTFKDSETIEVESFYGGSEPECYCPSLQRFGKNWCKEILDYMDNDDLTEDYREINGQNKGKIIFGITQNYQQWNEKEVRDSKDNIDKFFEKWVDKCSENVEPYLVSCIALWSAKYEKGEKEIENSAEYINKAIIYKYPDKQQINTEFNKLVDLRKVLEIERKNYPTGSKQYETITNLIAKVKDREEAYLKSINDTTDIPNSEIKALNSKIEELSMEILNFYEKSGRDKHILNELRKRGSTKALETTIDFWSIMQNF